MMLRVLLALMALLLSTPAVAQPGCHDMARPVAANAMEMAHHAPAAGQDPDRAIVAHVCPGCIPPSDWLRPRIAARLTATGVLPQSVIRRLTLRAGMRPALPPPRIV